MGVGSKEAALLLMSADDAARLGPADIFAEPKYDEPSLGRGEDGEDPTDELSVTDVPLDRGDVDDESESLSDDLDDADDIDETLRSFCATSIDCALTASMLVDDRKTGVDILDRSNVRKDDLVRTVGILAVSLLLLERPVKDLDNDMVRCNC